jgi:hypothetical protein
LNRKRLIALGASIALVLVLVLTGCAQAPAGGGGGGAPAGVATDKVYKVLNPQAQDQARDLSPLAPRIDTLAGKKILVVTAESSRVVMPGVIAKLQKEFPTSTFVYTESKTTSPIRATDEQLKGVQCAIIGNAW